jgi:hypothetical protein
MRLSIKLINQRLYESMINLRLYPLNHYQVIEVKGTCSPEDLVDINIWEMETNYEVGIDYEKGIVLSLSEEVPNWVCGYLIHYLACKKAAWTAIYSPNSQLNNAAVVVGSIAKRAYSIGDLIQAKPRQ